MLYASDLITQYLPWYALVQQYLHQFSLPHWVPDLYSTGYPLLAEGETGALSPLNALVLFVFPFPLAVNVLYLVYFLIAVTGVIYFLKPYRLSFLARLLGGLVFSLSGFMVSRYFQPAIIFSAALLPWGMLAVHRNSWWLPLIIYLQLTAGHLQIALISALAYIVYSPRLRTFLFVLLGLGLSAVQLLPSFYLYTHSDRRNWDPMVRFTYSLPPSHLTTYLFPRAFGISAPGDNLGFTQFGGSFWEFNLTIWTLPFLLSLLPLVFKRSRTVLILYGLWVLFLVLSFGGYTPLYRILARSPQFPFRAPSRFLLIPTFMASILAAYGFNLLVLRRKFSLRLIAFAIVIGSVLFQLINQLRNYFITATGFLPPPASATPLPLNPSSSVFPWEFVVKFHQGLIISLISLMAIFYVKIRHPRRLFGFTHRH